MHRIRDKKRWWVANFCTPTAKCRANSSAMDGLFFGIGALCAVMLLGVLMAGLASHAPGELTFLPMAGIVKELVEKRQELKTKGDKLAAVFEEAKTAEGYDFRKVKSLGEGKSSVEIAEAVKAMNEELNAIGAQIDSLASAEQAAADQKRRQEMAGGGGGIPHPEPGKEGEGKKEQKSIGQLFIESDAYKRRETPGITSTLEVELKALFSTTAGWAPETLRSPRVVDFATLQPRMIDVMPMTTTQQAAVKYMEETTFTDTAAEVAEGGLKPEAALALTERLAPLETIAVWIPVSEQQLDDVPRVQDYLERRLKFMVNRRLDTQLVVGTGVSPQIMGILNKPNIQTQAKGADPVPDAIRKAMTKVRVTGQAEPNAVIMHPNDWQDVRLLRTVDGIYIWGPPSEAGPQRIWGITVVENTGETENTGMVGDFANFAELVTKGQIQVQIGWVNDDFIHNRKAIRVEMRAAAIWYRPSAFCSVTGI